MNISFKLNKEAAQKSARVSSAINEKGAYVGHFTRAEYIESRNGTKGIEFDFITNDGASAKFMTVWFENSSGESLAGNNMIHGMMASVGARELTAQEATIKKYSQESRQEENCRATVFPALMSKPIGLVLCREEYKTSGGEYKWKNAIVAPFEAATGRSARERLENAVAEDIDKIVTALRDRPYREQQGGAKQAKPATGGGFADMDDDIPF